MRRVRKHRESAQPCERTNYSPYCAPQMGLLILGVAWRTGCVTHQDPQVAFDHAQRTFQHGDLALAQKEVKKGYSDFRMAGPEWSWKFRILEANVLYWQGLRDPVLALLATEPASPPSGELVIQKQK